MIFYILVIDLLLFGIVSNVVQSFPQAPKTENANNVDFNEEASKILKSKSKAIFFFANSYVYKTPFLSIENQDLLLKAAAEGNIIKKMCQ